MSDVEPRERCPNCGDLLEHASRDPLEEYCINPVCGYYRAESGGEIIRE